jgi:LytS/YehU family sensor histidine kinase
LHLSQRDIITLREELDLLKLYLDLEHRGCNGRFEYAVVVGENINVDAIKILPAWVFTPAHKPVPMK